jgi:hypothetical protein
LTPGDSDSEDATGTQQKPSFGNWSSSTNPGAAFIHAPEMVDGYRTHAMDMDMDMDMGDHVQDEAQLSTGHSQPDPMQPGGITSRMPTPIHCSFSAQIRGNNWSGAAGNAMQGPPPPPPLQSRRLPSPISESGGEELGSPRMMTWHDGHPGMPPRAASAMEISAPARTMGNLSIAGNDNMEVEAPSGQTPRKGHTRSRHTLNSWTQVPGMKKSFSIGFRTDCEKCRQKVPGHFNHIIVS